MLQRTYNEIVGFMLAANGDEFAQILALLPEDVKGGLMEELQKLSDAHRYDTAAQRAYYFELQGTGVAVWSWNHVHRPHEAGELIFHVVGSTAPLDEKRANECYARATGRTIENPGVTSASNEMAD